MDSSISPGNSINNNMKSRGFKGIYLILLTLFILLILSLGFNVYQFTKNNNNSDQDKTSGDSNEEITKTCNYANREYENGDTFQDKDGCNQCVCNNGEVVCTLVACDSDVGDNTVENNSAENDSNTSTNNTNEINCKNDIYNAVKDVYTGNIYWVGDPQLNNYTFNDNQQVQGCLWSTNDYASLGITYPLSQKLIDLGWTNIANEGNKSYFTKDGKKVVVNYAIGGCAQGSDACSTNHAEIYYPY